MFGQMDRRTGEQRERQINEYMDCYIGRLKDR